MSKRSSRLAARAQSRAKTQLTYRHAEEYRVLYLQAKEELREEKPDSVTE